MLETTANYRDGSAAISFKIAKQISALCDCMQDYTYEGTKSQSFYQRLPGGTENSVLLGQPAGMARHGAC